MAPMLVRRILMAFLLGPSVHAGNIDPANRYAYDANAGWIDFAPPVADSLVVGSYFLRGYAYSGNYGWIHFGSGPANKLAYSQTGADLGVNAEAKTGRLTGMAYSANIGWVNFGWAAFNDPNRARFSINSGTFSGSAYSANTGWISLSGVKSTSLAIADSDLDGMDDGWEMENFGNLTTAGVGSDFDKDGQSDAAEFAAGTLPKDNTSWLRITAYSNSSGATSHSITFTCTNTRLYQIWTSTTLGAGSWTIAPTVLQGNVEFPGAGTPTMTVTCNQPAGMLRFFRVVARKY